MKHRIFVALFGLVFIGACSLVAQPGSPGTQPGSSVSRSVFTDQNGVAVRGYDVVAYFTESDSVPGLPSISTTHEGVTYHFSSEEHLALFNADPARYLPAYGGFCAYAVANGYTASIQPDLWVVHKGRLYLNFNRGVYNAFLNDINGMIARGNNNWPGLKARLDR